MKKLLLPLLLLTAVTATAQQVKEKNIRYYASTITKKELKEKLSIIASAEMQGRATASEGQRRAAAYIESQFRKMGLTPANGGSFEQVFFVYQDTLLEDLLQVNGQRMEANRHYAIMLNSTSSGEWTINDLYFAGPGNLDTTNLPVEGKWVVMDEGNMLSLRQKMGQLRRRNAKGVIAISRNFPRHIPFQRKTGLYFDQNNMADMPYITVSYDAMAAMLNRSNLDSMALRGLDKQSFSSNATLRIRKEMIELESTNVLGMVEGSDKKGEYLFLTAHYDHLGMRGDSVIYYGADDDGSGTAAIIEIAEAFAEAKRKGHGPRRTIVFMAVSGEENGLWGSRFYSDNPVFPLENTTANLNIDMVGRIDPKYKGDSLNYVYVIGDDKLSSDLTPITDSVNRRYLGMELDRRYNDVSDPNRFYYRSDHYNFARKGVPIIFYFNGTHADYHRPTDTVDKINFDVMEKRVKLVFYTAWEMANREAMMKRDIPLNIPPR